MKGRAIVLRGDARNLPLPDESVDLIVTSPPYWALRDYRDGDQSLAGQIGNEASPGEYLESLWECTREWMRVLKPEGSLWINLGDKYSTGNSGQSGLAKLGEQWAGGGHSDAKAKRASRRVGGMPPKSLLGLPWMYACGCTGGLARLGGHDPGLNLILRAEVIWAKPNGLPESVTDRVRRSHEQWFHFVKQPRYFSAVDEIREPYSDKTVRTYPTAYGAPGTARQGRDSKTLRLANNPLGALPGSVWEIPTEPLRVPEHLGVDHYAAFPTAWPRRIITGWSPAGGLVVDPFGGTGTTALVASTLGRRGISIDRSADYCRIAQWRTADPGERARALGLPKPPPENPSQERLFEEIA